MKRESWEKKKTRAAAAAPVKRMRFLNTTCATLTAENTETDVRFYYSCQRNF